MNNRAVPLLSCLIVGGLALAACGGKPAVVLPSKLDIEVAAGDLLHSCPAEDVSGQADPATECVIGKKDAAFEPYKKALGEKGWSEQGRVWVSSAADGAKTCLQVASFPQVFNMRDRTLLEFRLLPSCDPLTDLEQRTKAFAERINKAESLHAALQADMAAARAATTPEQRLAAQEKLRARFEVMRAETESRRP